uniref:Acyl-[acyl-carrier-protein]--UDP-N-acetylglucosamine O-acyltransferase n=1 Tax=Solanum tuberosum TaxID=4113 RepID=M0ZHJ1_SOLTU
MSSLFFSSSRRPLSVALRRFTLCRFSSIVTYATEEEKSRFIHPSSVVHPNAILGEGVSIGPFCTIGPFAKLGRACQLYPGSHIFGNTELGDNCILMTVHILSSGAVIGDDLPGQTVVGRNNVFGHHAVIGVKCQDMKYKVIGDNNLIMGSCHIAHDCKVGNNNILANSTLLAGHVVVEDYAHTAGGIVVHQFCRIGSYSFIGGGSVVSQDVPKYIIVSGERAELRGLNLEGLRRRGFSAVEIKSLRAAYRKIFMPTDTSSGNIEDRLSQVEQHEDLGLFPAVSSMVQSIRDSFAENRRGICKFRSWSGS